jgi:hypothetical protein
VEKLMTLMNDNIQNEPVFSKGMSTVGKLSKTAEVSKEIIKQGGIKVLDKIPKTYFDLLKFLRALSLFVGRLSDDAKT